MAPILSDESHPEKFAFGNTGAVNGFVAQLATLNLSYIKRGIHMKRLAG